MSIISTAMSAVYELLGINDERDFRINGSKLIISGHDYADTINLPYKTKPSSMSAGIFGDRIAIGYPAERAVLTITFNYRTAQWEEELLKRDVNSFGASVAMRLNRLAVTCLENQTYVYEYDNYTWEPRAVIHQRGWHVCMSPDSSRVLIADKKNVHCYNLSTFASSGNWKRRQILESAKDILGIKIKGNKLFIKHKDSVTEYLLESIDGSNDYRVWIPE